MDILQAIHARRSIRSYERRPVARDVIEAIILDAAQAPPPFRGQVPWVFNVIAGRERIAGLGARAMAYAQAGHNPDAPGWGWLGQPDFEIFWGAPVVVIISGPLADCCRAGQTLMLSAHARGLGTCWVGSPLPWLITEAVKGELRIPLPLTPMAVFCLGYPQATPQAMPKPPPPIIGVD